MESGDEGTTTLEPDTIPLRPDPTPLKPDTGSLRSDTTPLRSDTTHLRSETSPPRQDDTTLRPDTMPLRPDAAPLRLNTLPLIPNIQRLEQDTPSQRPDSPPLRLNDPPLEPDAPPLRPSRQVSSLNQEPNSMEPTQDGPDEIADVSARFLNANGDDDCSYEFGPVVSRRPGLGRYKQGLRNVIPVRCAKKSDNTLPLETNGLLNYMTFGWLSRYMWQVYKKGSESLKDLRITYDESAQVNAQRMERFWREELSEKGQSDASFAHAILRSFKTRLAIGAIASLVYAFLTLANPILVIRYFLTYLSEESVTIKSGIVYAAAMGLILLLRGVTGAFFWMLNYEAATRIKYGTLALLYRKILHLKSLKDKSIGDMVNFISNDGQRLWDGIIMGPFVIGAPMIVVISCVYSVVLMGPWVLVSFIIILGFYPFAMSFARMSQTYRENSIKITDRRISLMNALLTSIKLVKMYAWELSFSKQISEIRADEQTILEKSVFVQSVSMGSSMLVPIFASCIMFIAYVATGHNLTATEAFTFVSLLNTMQASMSTLPFALKALSEMVVSTRRIQEILLMDEISSLPSPISSNITAVEMNNLCLSWSSDGITPTARNGLKVVKRKAKKQKKKKVEETEHLQESLPTENRIFVGPTLENINLIVKKGQLLGVCGSVGSGKSSLINAILGRMNVTSGSIAVAGRTAYVSQQAWVTNDTVKNNIVFGYDLDENRYHQVLHACALEDDLKSFPQGDLTEVGERGMNLSGGQKQRISLARAAYSTCDIILLDDPLSAVDVHLGQHIFQHCILGLLKGRTIIFVTHALEFLKYCDEILVMRDGAITEKGSHEDVLATGKEYAGLLSLYHNSKDAETGERQVEISETKTVDPSISPDVIPNDNKNNSNLAHQIQGNKSVFVQSEKDDNKQEKFKLIEDEETDRGTLTWEVIHHYILSMGGYIVMFLVLFCFCLPVAGVTTAGWYLSYWLEQGAGNQTLVVDNATITNTRVVDNPDLGIYLMIYAGFIPLLIIVTIVRSFSITKAALQASTNLHDVGFKKILQCPMSFFDVTPVGRIVNRFSADLDEIDVRLPMNAEIFLTNVLQVFGALAMIGYVSPWFLLAVIPLGILFFLLMIIFHVCVCELKCLDNVTRSPVISHMTASVQGLACIHAYHKTNDYIKKYCDLLNTNAVAVLLFQSSNRWLALRLDIVCAGVAFLTGLLILATYDHLNPALAGLALSFALQLSALFQYTARLAVETEARFTSVKRILEYCNVKESETMESIAVLGRPPSDWPQAGVVVFNNVKLRYRPELPLALKGLTFKVESHEKIGIVGRSGAGKTSISVALFRLVELESGQIFIDGQDISHITHDDLRSRLSIIPQDPVLFAGTIRYNLDPFGQFSESEIWQALDKCYVASLVKLLDQQLDTNVVEGGDNFSVGEKQLICMARALLRNSKILVLDEATAAIDTETDHLVQKTLQQVFCDCTMFVIAHRLSTVKICDKIILLENGMIKEFDTPTNLLSTSNSKFKDMWEASGSRLLDS
ncbi:unnamed protein product [Lymnaea stagnalis]|uniref:Multidrug resistance-associated protein 5-like n=1 Tax=Lymnaea stagnalis TaxID=6523 RepID=A0AAV2IFV5_LYMST